MTVLCFAVGRSTAQNAAVPPAVENRVVLVSLFQPSYPQLPLVAGISGDVELALAVRQDGSVESAVAVSGHPLLKQAALNSAKQSQFQCQGCNQELTSYRMVYKFELGETKCLGEHHPQVIQSQNEITVFDNKQMFCDEASDLSRKTRTLKCLYLWRYG